MVMTGKTISHYKILDKLGEGGMGVVYKAHDTKLDRTVALKFFPPNLAVDDTEKQRFLHEARAASALDHSNICSTYSIEETDDGSMFIVMAYYDGVSLQGKIGQSPLPIKEVLAYSIQIAAGLKKAHEKEIVHRDLKPANIFITKDDQIKIIDFGLAKAAHRTMLTKSGTTLGTVPYMSPEQAQGNQADNRTDIWSLGVVMYEMITGRRPFKSEYETALVYSIMNEDPEPVTGLRSGVPILLEGIVRKCLEKDPQNRYQHVDEIIVDLRRVEKEISSGIHSKATVSGQPTKIDAQEDHTVTRRIHPLVYGIPVLLLVLIGLFVYLPDRTTVTEMSRSIAVLPLENLSPDPDDAYFAAGMHEDIIIQLSRIGDIQVIARSSVLGYDAGQRNIQRISNELGVQTILEGSIRRVVNRVRVAVTLTDVQTNRTLWADAFDRDLTDIFAIQSEIAIEIANALEARLTDVEKRQLVENPTAVTEAYEYYLRAREYFTRPGSQYDAYSNAEFLLMRAIEYDPQFAHAHALLSRAYSTLRWFGYDTSSETLELSLQSAMRAFQLQPDLPEAHIAMGYYYYYGFRDYDNALEHFNNALRFQPNNAEIIAAIGFVERRLGRFENSISNLSKAISLDPEISICYLIMHNRLLLPADIKKQKFYLRERFLLHRILLYYEYFSPSMIFCGRVMSSRPALF
jgi:eukaryotic-like serine/threonine-protein kinase